MLQVSATHQANTNTGGAIPGTGASSVADQLSVVVAPTDTTKLSLLHSANQNNTVTPGTSSSVESSGVKLDQKLGATASAAISMQNTTTTTGNTTDQEQTVGVGISAKPVDQVKMDMNYGSLNNASVGHQTSQNANIVLAPVKDVSINASYSGVDSTKLGSTQRTNVAFSAKPVDDLQIQGDLTNSADPLNQQYQHDLKVISTPVSFAKLSASFSENGLNDVSNATKGATLELQPFTSTKLSAGYSYVQTGQNVMTVRDFAAASKFTNMLSISGNLRQRDSVNDVPDSTGMQLALTPLKCIQSHRRVSDES